MVSLQEVERGLLGLFVPYFVWNIRLRNLWPVKRQRMPANMSDYGMAPGRGKERTDLRGRSHR